MKKIIGIIILLMSGVLAVSAQPALALGVRGIYSTSVGTSIEDPLKNIWESTAQELSTPYIKYSGELKNKAKSGGGFALFAKIPLGRRFGAQIEFGYTYNVVGLQCILKSDKFGKADKDDEIVFHTLNLPFLLTFDIVQTRHFILTPHVGLYIAKPVGKTEGPWGVKENITTTALFGAVVGGSATLRFGKVGIIADMRYNIGFNSLVSSMRLITPRSLQISGGVAILMN